MGQCIDSLFCSRAAGAMEYARNRRCRPGSNSPSDNPENKASRGGNHTRPHVKFSFYTVRPYTLKITKAIEALHLRTRRFCA